MLSPEVLDITPRLIAWRRQLHRDAELSFEEYRTTDMIEENLRSFGVTDICRPCKTGLVVQITGAKPGAARTLGIRADIDALPIQESPELPFASVNPGAMHACGHDGHTAILLAAAKILQESRESFCGTVRLLFQHAEELPPGGAIEMVRAGAAEGLDAVLGLHLSSAFPVGVFGVREGVLTSNVDRFDITLHGKGGHCSYPEQCIDVITCGAQLITALQTVVSRRVAAVAPTVLSICQVQAGNAYNILPNDFVITGTTRCLGPEARKFLRQEMERITRGVAGSGNCTYDFQWQEGYPSVINDVELTKMARRLIEDRFGPAAAMTIDPQMPGEDYPYFLEDGRRPGFFVELGTRNAEKGCDWPHHNPRYRMDEDALPLGVQYTLDMTREFLNGEAR